MKTFVDVLQARAVATPDRLAFAFLGDGQEITERITYVELHTRARSIAVELSRVLSPGDRAVLFYPSGVGFIEAFLGCLYADVVAVPILPPLAARLRKAGPRLVEILRTANPQAILTCSTKSYLRSLTDMMDDAARIRWLETDKIETRQGALWRRPSELSPDSIAFLQFTSGSTGSPKGVIVTQGNLVANAEMISRAFAMSDRDVICHWLPLYHDMGLIGCTLAPIASGSQVYFMSPMEFLLRPVRWLRAFSKFGGTIGAAPNFGYELCIQRCTEANRATLDLSTWTRALNGAEPIVEATLSRFAATFADVGFERSSFRPCYGLAEATLLVSGTVDDPEPVAISVARDPLAHGQVETAALGDPNPMRLMASGTLVPSLHVEIVDPAERVKSAPNQVGEIWVRGPSVAMGYWRNDEATAATFEGTLLGGRDRFLRTGDLGFVRGTHLVVTGRLKDLIIQRGANHYPQDLERTVEHIEGVKVSGAAAFSIRADGSADEDVVIVVERRRGSVAAAPGEPTGNELGLDAFMERVRHELNDLHGVAVFDVCLVSPGSIPRTSSGKVQRGAARNLYLSHQFNRLQSSAEAGVSPVTADH